MIRRLLRIVVPILVVAVGGWFVLSTLYLAPRRDLVQKIDSSIEDVNAYRKALRTAAESTSRLQAIADTTLGTLEDEVVHRFRTRLLALASEAGITDPVIGTNRASPVGNPAGGRSGLPTSVRKLFRDIGTDFAVVRGDIRASGSLDSAVEFMAALESQPWVHQITGFSWKPIDETRTVFEIRVNLVTIYLPDLAPATEPPMSPPLEESQWASIVSKNIFRVPDPPPPPEVEIVQAPVRRDPEPTPPPPPPYHEWKQTGIVIGRNGPMVMMQNTRTGEWLTLTLGQQVLGLSFEDGDGEHALWAFGEARFEVFNGETLDARTPLTDRSSAGGAGKE
ncbi:MAG: hypothetical protein KDA28_06785 [Phycisphaerales bacterium]|nr:hypothetical protein [Phycisphaerales bacterium]